MLFKSKIDAWLIVVIGAGLLIPVALVGSKLARPDAHINGATAVIVGLVALGVPVVIIAWCFLTTAYTITATDLIVRSGPVNLTIRLSSVRKIRPTRSILSAPALSLDRLEITYNVYDSVVISPEDKQEFLNEMKRRVPQATIEGV